MNTIRSYRCSMCDRLQQKTGRKVVWILVGLLAVIALPGSIPAAEPDSPGRQWAILIGIEGYHRANRLRFTNNDVKQLAHTLSDRGGVPKENILEIVDTASDARYQPLRTSLLAELPRWLAKPKPADQVLVYFSGHGFRDKQGRLYLAPIDCDPQTPEATCIPVQWLRERLAACKAGFKLLVLDACHAGTEQAEGSSATVPAGEIGELFRDMLGVVTLASSTSDEKSQIWGEKQQSLFTYWLNQGLKGHADTDGDSAVSIDELYNYVHRNVTHSAKTLFPRPQTPVRIVRSGTVGVPNVVRLQPQPLSQVLSDMAEQLAWAIEERQLVKVGVLEFTNDTQLGELLGAEFGLLGRSCATNLEKQLLNLAAGKYDVVNRRSLQTALRSQNFSLDDLGSTEALRRLSNAVGGMPSIALGTLRNRSGRLIHLHCDLLETDGNALAASAGGTALLNESEWAMIGRSVQVKPEDRRLPAAGSAESDGPQAERVIEQLDKRAEGAHPLLDRNFPYRIRIMVGGKEREPVFSGNDCYVALSPGEEYEIWVENNSGRLTVMRLLVDGLNTLPQKETVKGVATYLVGAPVSLAEARFWILDPESAKTHAVRGFVTETGREGKLRKFTVVDAQKSLAARQRFTEQIGMITAAFYAPAGGSRAIGTAAGEERVENLEEAGGVKVGNLLGVVHIRYVEPEALGDNVQPPPRPAAEKPSREEPSAERPSAEKPQTKVPAVVVIAERATLKSGRQKVGLVPRGNILDVKNVQGNWFWVEWQHQEGWIHTNDVVPFERALEYFTESLRRNPNADNYICRANILRHLEEYDRAIADFDEAQRLDPDNADIYRNRAIAWGITGEYDKAIADLTEAIRLTDANRSPAHRIAKAKCYYGRGLAWSSKGDQDRAIADFTQAIRFDPKFALAYWFRGDSWRRKGDQAKAEADFQQAARLGYRPDPGPKGTASEAVRIDFGLIE